jgi:site-specific DNA-methyltransferase (adenine-specific)
MIKLMQGDCLERMKEIESGSVDAVICDLPYGTMKGTYLDGWKKSTTEWDVCIDHNSLMNEYNRILRPNGALLLFCQDPLTGKLMTEQHGNLPFSYRYTWLKDHFANALMAKKAPVNYTEDICVFFKRHPKHDFYSVHPLREYASLIMLHAGKSLKDINKDLGHRRAEHFFYVDSTQFGICTEQTYNELMSKYGIDSMEGFKEFAEIKEIDAAFRDRLISSMTDKNPRRFNLSEGSRYKPNILQYKKDYDGYHPTQKPVNLIEDLIKTYTIPGETVLDNTMGSGTTGVAAVNTGRKFIGIELDEHYFQIAQNRINEALSKKAAA